MRFGDEMTFTHGWEMYGGAIELLIGHIRNAQSKA